MTGRLRCYKKNGVKKVGSGFGVKIWVKSPLLIVILLYKNSKSCEGIFTSIWNLYRILYNINNIDMNPTKYFNIDSYDRYDIYNTVMRIFVKMEKVANYFHINVIFYISI